jgi:hypothetical protein
MNIIRHIDRAAIFCPDHAAILFEGSDLSGRELNLCANRPANAPKAHGVQRGGRRAGSPR